MTAAISNTMVGLLHKYTGRGPTRARTTIGTDIIVCVMGATLTKGEQSLVADGKQEVLLYSRRAFQDTMQADAITAVQELFGRRVVAFMSNNHTSIRRDRRSRRADRRQTPQERGARRPSQGSEKNSVDNVADTLTGRHKK